MSLSYKKFKSLDMNLEGGYVQIYKPSNNTIKMLDFVIVDYLLRTVESGSTIPTINNT